MRSIQRQLQDVWFCDYTEKLSGYDTVKVFGKPIRKRFPVSDTSGWAYGSANGFRLDYSRIVTCYEHDFKPEEGTMVFVDVIPDIDEDGNLKIIDVPLFEMDGVTPETDEDGNQLYAKEYATTPDYRIDKVHYSLRHKVTRFNLKKV